MDPDLLTELNTIIQRLRDEVSEIDLDDWLERLERLSKEKE